MAAVVVESRRKVLGETGPLFAQIDQRADDTLQATSPLLNPREGLRGMSGIREAPSDLTLLHDLYESQRQIAGEIQQAGIPICLELTQRLILAAQRYGGACQVSFVSLDQAENGQG